MLVLHYLAFIKGELYCGVIVVLRPKHLTFIQYENTDEAWEYSFYHSDWYLTNIGIECTAGTGRFSYFGETFCHFPSFHRTGYSNAFLITFIVGYTFYPVGRQTDGKGGFYSFVASWAGDFCMEWHFVFNKTKMKNGKLEDAPCMEVSKVCRD